MARLKTLSDIRTQVRRRADMENSLFVSDSEIDQYIQDSWGELYDLLLENAPTDHFAQMTSANRGVAGWPFIDIDSDILADLNVGTGSSGDMDSLQSPGSGAAEISSGAPIYKHWVYKVVSVHVADNYTVASNWSRLQVAASDSHLGSRGRPTSYRVTGPSTAPGANTGTDHRRRIYLSPTPDIAYYYQVMWIPSAPDLTTVSAGETIATHSAVATNIMHFAGWDEYVVCDAAAKCLEKEESWQAADRLLRRKAQAEQRIRWHAQTMNADGAGSVRDVDDAVSRNWRGEPW